jgi:2-iminobutanoate/2-iminopropanoate deaminase
MPRNAVETDKIAVPVGPFSAAIQARGFVYLSGQIAQNPRTGKIDASGVAAQTEQTFRNIEALLQAAGKSLGHMIKVTVSLTDMKEFAAMNAVYERQFEKPYPARTTIAVSALPLGAAVELDVVAA